MVSNIKRICFRILTTLRFLQVMGETVRGRRSLEDKMRIKVFFHSSLQSMETEKRLVSQAVEDVENMIMVREPMTGEIKMNRECLDNTHFSSPGEVAYYCKEECVREGGGYDDLLYSYAFVNLLYYDGFWRR